MPLEVDQFPLEAREIAVSQLRQALRLAPSERFVLREVSASDLSLALPHPVYALGLRDIGDSQALNKLKPVGWRFLVMDEDRVVAGIEVDIVSAPKGLRFGRIVQGPFESAIGKESSPQGSVNVLHVVAPVSRRRGRAAPAPGGVAVPPRMDPCRGSGAR